MMLPPLFVDGANIRVDSPYGPIIATFAGVYKHLAKEIIGEAMNDAKELLGAIARGWCHPKNEGKTFDPDLAIAIAAEINALRASPPEAVERDAARYRWLRRDDELIGAEPFICRKGGDAFSRWTLRDADAAVDAAMSMFYVHDAIEHYEATVDRPVSSSRSPSE